MSDLKDKGDRENKVDPGKPYAVGNKKPPLHTRFKPESRAIRAVARNVA
jgi:hypothetical protein